MAYPGRGRAKGISATSTLDLTNLPPTTCFLILGTPQDTDGDGLTDAYELLVSKTDPNNRDSNLDGILDGWDVLLGLNPHQQQRGHATRHL